MAKSVECVWKDWLIDGDGKRRLTKVFRNQMNWTSQAAGKWASEIGRKSHRIYLQSCKWNTRMSNKMHTQHTYTSNTILSPFCTAVDRYCLLLFALALFLFQNRLNIIFDVTNFHNYIHKWQQNIAFYSIGKTTAKNENNCKNSVPLAMAIWSFWCIFIEAVRWETEKKRFTMLGAVELCHSIFLRFSRQIM